MLALNILNEKMKNREIKKYYLCKIHGSFDNKTDILSDFLTKQKEETGVIVSKKPLNNESSRISTQYTSLAYDKEGNAVLEINLITGKKHQIRAHMLFYNHPLFGEQKYTKKEFSDKYDNQFLVSYKVVFEFHTPSSILAYLDKKIITLDKDKIVNKLLENKI
jgi:23S rRNA pseudouridine955/2504/2580 synthase